jgi:hypothetical protein
VDKFAFKIKIIMDRAIVSIRKDLNDAYRRLEPYGGSILVAINNLRDATENGVPLTEFEVLYRAMTDLMSAEVIRVQDEAVSYDIYDVMLTLYARMAVPVRVLYPTATCVFDNQLYFKA